MHCVNNLLSYSIKIYKWQFSKKQINMKKQRMTFTGALAVIAIIVSVIIPEIRAFLGFKDPPPPSVTVEVTPPTITPAKPSPQPGRNFSKGKYEFASYQYLSEQKLKSYSSWDLRIMRNEIYARHGYIFNRSPKMITYFSKQDWYRKTLKISTDDIYIYKTKFSDIERDNVLLIKKVENLK